MNSDINTQQHRFNQLEEIRYKLWSINKLPLTDIHNVVLQLIPLQSVDQFIPMTRECIKVSKRDPYLIKYLDLFDMLLNHPVFNHQLHLCLVQFYSKIVSYLKNQKLWAEIEQSKILRKYWAKRIHYQMYQDLKSETFRITGIDVDNILSVQAIQNIRHYYVHVLHLPPHQLYYYLPQISQTPSPHSYPLPTDQRGQEQYKLQNQYCHNDASKHKNSQHQKVFFTQKTVINPQNFIKNTNHQHNIPPTLENTTQNQNSPKKIRCQSEQTNPGDNLESLRKVRYLNNHQTQYLHTKEQQTHSTLKQKEPKPQQLNHQVKGQPKPLIEKSKQQLEAASILAKLNSLSCYQCKQCGMRFQTEQSRKEHTESHVTGRLKQLDIKEEIKFGSKKNVKKSSFVTSTFWNSTAQQEEESQINIALRQTGNLKQQICPVCSQAIKVVWRGQKWVYNNTIRAILNSGKKDQQQQYLLIHKSCAKIMENDQSLSKNERILTQ